MVAAGTGQLADRCVGTTQLHGCAAVQVGEVGPIAGSKAPLFGTRAASRDACDLRGAGCPGSCGRTDAAKTNRFIFVSAEQEKTGRT